VSFRKKRESDGSEEKDEGYERCSLGEEKYYDQVAKSAWRKVIGESSDGPSTQKHEVSERETCFWGEGDEAHYEGVAQRAFWNVLGNGERRSFIPVECGSEKGDIFPVRVESDGFAENLEQGVEDLSALRGFLCREEVRSDLGVRRQVLERYHELLGRLEELLRKLSPNEFESSFRNKILNDRNKPVEIRQLLDRVRGSDCQEWEQGECQELLDEYEKLLNKWHDTLSRINSRAEPFERESGNGSASEPEFTVRVDGTGWVQQDGDEKTVVRRESVSGERLDGARFEQSVQTIQSETPLGSMESSVERTMVRVEKEEDADEDVVQRVWGELTRIEEAFRTWPRDEETAIKQYIIAVNPILELLEKQEEENESKRVITVYDRGEHEWLKKVDYVLKTVKWWVDEEGVTHFEQCTQAVGYERAENPETEADKPWGRAVTYKLKFGREKEQKMCLETNLIEFNPVVTFENGEEENGLKDESKSVIEGDSVGSSSFETDGERTGQQAVLAFYRGEKDEEPENAQVEHIIYKVVHEPSLEETTSTGVVESVQEVNESTIEIDNLEEISDGSYGLVGSADTIDAVGEVTSQFQQVEEAVESAISSREETEEKSETVSVKQSIKSLQKEVWTGEESREEGEREDFILVESAGRRRIFPFRYVLEMLAEGVRKSGEDETRYCEELKKRGAPPWIFPWLLRQMLYERRIPEEVLRAAVKYLEKEIDIEVKCEGYLKAVERTERVKVIHKEELEDISGGLETRIEFLTLPSGKLVSLTEDDNFLGIANVIEELLDSNYQIESAESDYYVVTLPNGIKYRVGPVSCFLVLQDGRKIAVMLPEPAVVIQKAPPNLKVRLKKVVENIMKSEEESLRYFKAFTTEDDLLFVLKWWVDWHLSGLSEATEDDIEEALQSFESRLQKMAETLSERYVSLSRKKLENIRETAKGMFPQKYIKSLSERIGISEATLEGLRPEARVKKGILLKIYDVLNLPYPKDLCADRKELLVALLTAKGEKVRQKPERPWWEQPAGTYCILNKEDIEKAYHEAIAKYGTKSKVLELLQKAGLKHIHWTTISLFLTYRFYDVEKIRKLLKIIGWKPQKIRELNLNELKDNDSLSLLEEGKGGSLELINAIKEKRKEENSKESLFEYAARKLSEELRRKKKRKVKISSDSVRRWLNKKKGISKENYLLMCSVFGVKPNEYLHSRKKYYIHGIDRKMSNEVNFRKPAKFVLKNGEIIKIIENQGEFYVVTKDGKFSAKKYINKIGGEGWGLTIIDYETEDGVYTVVKELGELWLPDTQPWYITFKNLRLEVNPKLLKNIIKTLQNALKPEEDLKKAEEEKEGEDETKLRKISEITRTNLQILKKWANGYKHTQLKRLVEFIALQSALTGENAKNIFKMVEPQIEKISRVEIENSIRKNLLYMNLGTIFGVALIGHTLSDSFLKHKGGEPTEFIYYNSEYANIDRVRKLIEYFGQPGKIYSRKRYSWSTSFQINVRTLLAQAIRRVIPYAAGKKTLRNPPVPKRITNDKQKALALLQSVIIDEATIDYRNKETTVQMSVDVTEEIGEESVNSLVKLTRKRLEEIKPQKHLLEKTLEIFKNENIKYKNNKEIKTVLEVAMKRLEREGIQVGEDDLEKIFEYLSNDTKITRGTIKNYLHFIEVYACQIDRNEVGSEIVKRAELKTNNILQAVVRAFKTLGINPVERGIRDFYVSKDERVTARSGVALSKDEASKAYELGIIKGYKKEKYEVSMECESVRLVDRKKGVCKLSENQINILESKKSKINRVFYSKIKNYPDIVDVIQRNKPKKLEEKFRNLDRNGVKATLDPKFMYVGKVVITVEWYLTSWHGNNSENRQEKC